MITDGWFGYPCNRFQIGLREPLEDRLLRGHALEIVARAVSHPAQRRFQFDEQPEPVALVEELLGRRIMRSADEIAIPLAENRGVFLPQFRAERPAQQRMHFMPADAVNLDRGSIDEDLIAANFDLAEAESLLDGLFVADRIFCRDGQLVKMRMFVIPFLRILHGDGCSCHFAFLRRLSRSISP